MMARCAESSHGMVIEPMSNGQSSILSSSVSVVEIGRELAELTALWARMETALWRERSALWNERFPERPIDLDDSPWYETQEAPVLESARGGKQGFRWRPRISGCGIPAYAGMTVRVGNNDARCACLDCSTLSRRVRGVLSPYRERGNSALARLNGASFPLLRE